MKHFIYVWRHVSRSKLHSSLTILSMAFSMALMTILYGYLAMQDVAEREAKKYDLAIVLNKIGFAAPLPIAHVDRIRKMDGVTAAIPYAWFGGNYKDEQQPFAQFATDPESAFEVLTDFEIPAEQVAAFKDNRRGCIVDKSLAEERGWEVGERIPLRGMIYPANLDLQLVGIYEGGGFAAGTLLFNWSYLDEELKRSAGGFSPGAGMIYVKCAEVDEVEMVCNEIDAMFANSENSTRTRTAAAFARMFADMLGDVQTYVRYISIAVVFSLTLVAGTAMAMSMRERTTEVAVLKAIGYSRLLVLSLVLGESTTIAMLGGMLGIAGGLGGLHLLSQVPVAANLFPVPVIALAGLWLGGLVFVAAAIGFVSGLVPAVSAAQLSVVDGLRRVI